MSDQLREQVEVSLALAEKESAAGYLQYLHHVTIESLPEPRRFALAAYPWQWADARRLAPPLEEIAGLDRGRSYVGPRNFWYTRARGHDKTSSFARAINWLLAFSKRNVECVHGAADKDQAKLLTEAMRKEVEYNPFLASKVKISDYGAAGPRGRLKIITSDAPSAFGSLTDLFTLDEVTWWKSPALWEPLWSGRDKRSHALFVVITNAGVIGSWQYKLLEAALASPSWYVWNEPIRLPTWMNEEQIRENEALLLPTTAKRVIRNLWVDPGEESGFLTREDVLECAEAGARLGLERQERGVPGVEYVFAIDYGPKKDRTVLAVTHQQPDGLIVVDQMDVWQGSREAPIQISAVEDWIDSRRAAFPDCRLVVDPYQLEGTVQRYEQRMPAERFEARGGKGNFEMAETIRSLVVNRRIAWPAGTGDLVLASGRTETLADEMCGLVLRELPYGYRFDHRSGGHDDRTVTLGMASVLHLNRQLPSRWVAPPTAEQYRAVIGPRKRGSFRGLWGLE